MKSMLALHWFGCLALGMTLPAAAHQRSATLAEMHTADASKRPAQEIRNVVQAQFATFRACYESLLKIDPKAAGKVVVAFSITPVGGVTGAAVTAESTLRQAQFSSCIVAGFAGLKFAANSDTEPTTVTYPLAFSPG